VILEDVQASPDKRGFALEDVGITGLRYPVVIADRSGSSQATIADVTMSVDLSADVKGTHLSRFVEVLDEHASEISMTSLPTLVNELRRRLVAKQASIELSFPYFGRRSAPVTGREGFIDYAVVLRACASDERSEQRITVRVPVTSVCPCSKAISDYGAHNQRGFITIRVTSSGDPATEQISIDELIAIAESSGSSPVYPVLKRPDERYVTMSAYDAPVFVEDMVRNAAAVLQQDRRVDGFMVEAVNDESIHNHGAFARLKLERQSESAEQ
jgi:GTP cyclohydrolase I